MLQPSELEAVRFPLIAAAGFVLLAVAITLTDWWGVVGGGLAMLLIAERVRLHPRSNPDGRATDVASLVSGALFLALLGGTVLGVSKPWLVMIGLACATPWIVVMATRKGGGHE